MKAWWYRPAGFTNFGDELGAEFLRLLGHEIEYAPIAEADIFASGSILQRLNMEPHKDGLILWGTGWHKQPLRKLDGLDVRMVRGALTAEQLGVDVPFGDPGLLASYFYSATGKKHKLGFVRHYIDQTTEIPGAVLIDPTWPVEAVCRAIAECDSIVSSSLHGCIVAASYGIPYMRLPHDGVAGGDTKWVDFQTSLTKPLELIQKDLIGAING